MPVNIINLKRSPDRLQFMSRQCYIYGIPFIIHNAVDGTTYTFTDKEKALFNIQNKQTMANKKITACSLSHIQLWRKYQYTSEPYIMILEDDGLLQYNMRQHVNTCIRTLEQYDPDWHILWLSGNDPKNREKVIRWNYYNVYRMYPPEYIGQGAGAYIMSQRGIQHFLYILETSGCSEAIDWFLFKSLDKQHSYGVHPPLVDIHHNSMASTIV